MVVLDHNLFEIPAASISDTQALLTLLDGKIIYSREQARP